MHQLSTVPHFPPVRTVLGLCTHPDAYPVVRAMSGDDQSFCTGWGVHAEGPAGAGAADGAESLFFHGRC